jgi:hypothetical protein
VSCIFIIIHTHAMSRTAGTRRSNVETSRALLQNDDEEAAIRNRTLLIIEYVLMVAFACTLVGLAAFIYHVNKTTQISVTSGTCELSDAVVDNDACPPANPFGCQSGALVTTSTGEELCRYYNHTVGAACTSTCHVEDTTATCDADQLCSSDDPLACLGYCESAGDSTSDAEECVGKLSFMDFYTMDNAHHSTLQENWVHYTDYPGECWQNEGCHWYATFVQLYTLPDVYFPNNQLFLPTCVGLLNMTNTECIRYRQFNFGDNLGTAWGQKYMDEVYNFTGISTSFQAYGCVYWYSCGVRNESYMLDPDNIQEASSKKRNAAATAPVDKFVALVETHSDAMKRAWASPLAAMKSRREQQQNYIADILSS